MTETVSKYPVYLLSKLILVLFTVFLSTSGNVLVTNGHSLERLNYFDSMEKK